ncbi:alpha/beta fold hydrolase [Amycolatopsis thermophila]|uniref:Pimeloyl-ACP methyl ester carboxylesterase n=1 Tax=Amycolatopsis thermophila TaxID=206084 RepID=A0ABU0F090_9PSEU|nr:alpha/beta hydrolase [Amycolatopsis thermophila]MDQ0380987.1 pimeloyl-ACP methyl ester carboxylesterase [Amycolatopsis thermophila]
MPVELHSIRTNGIATTVAAAGTGPAVLLLHGFPHTWQLWQEVMPRLAMQYRVLAPDLRWTGSDATDGHDAATLADDALGILDALGERSAAVVGIDAGTPPAALPALRNPDRVRRLVLMESLLGTLPGAEDFLAGGPPWWFGFHAVPGLAEEVLAGHEAAYLDFFLDAGTHGQGVPAGVRDAFVRAYTGSAALRRAFSYYRALPESARQIAAVTRGARLTVPTLAVGAHPVGDALARQLRPHTDDLREELIEDCGHIIPLHRPAELVSVLEPFLAG